MFLKHYSKDYYINLYYKLAVYIDNNADYENFVKEICDCTCISILVVFFMYILVRSIITLWVKIICNI